MDNNILYDLILLNGINGLLSLLIINFNRFHELLFNDRYSFQILLVDVTLYL